MENQDGCLHAVFCPLSIRHTHQIPLGFLTQIEGVLIAHITVKPRPACAKELSCGIIVTFQCNGQWQKAILWNGKQNCDGNRISQLKGTRNQHNAAEMVRNSDGTSHLLRTKWVTTFIYTSCRTCTCLCVRVCWRNLSSSPCTKVRLGECPPRAWAAKSQACGRPGLSESGQI